MDKFRKALSFVLLSMLAFSGILFGCAGKYDNMKLTSSADGEREVVLYVPNDGQEGSTDSSITITYTVSGVGNDVSRDIILPGSDEYLDVSEPQKDGEKTVVTVTAKKGTITAHDFIATTKEGGVKNIIKIRCEKRITEINLSGKQYAITNKENQSLQLNTAELLSFEPEDATQKDVVYSTSAAGVTLTENGLLTINERLSIDEIPVTIQSKYNSGLSVETSVRVVTELAEDDIAISTIKNGEIAAEDIIEIMSNVSENSIQNLKVQINRNDLAFKVNFAVDGMAIAKFESQTTVRAISDGDGSSAEATLSSYDYSSDGSCKLYVSISLADYLGIETLVVTRNVKVTKIGRKLQVTENRVNHTSNFAIELSTVYGNEQNGLPLLIQFLDDPKDNRFFLAVEGNIGLYDQAMHNSTQRLHEVLHRKSFGGVAQLVRAVES